MAKAAASHKNITGAASPTGPLDCFAVARTRAIYEARFVKPPVQGVFVGSPRTFPLAVGIGRSAHFSRRRGFGLCLPTRILLSPRRRIAALRASWFSSSGDRRHVMRSTIYSGSPGDAGVAMKKIYEGRHHSPWRWSTMGSPSWHGSGSSSRSSRPPVWARQTTSPYPIHSRAFDLTTHPGCITPSPRDNADRFATSTPSSTASAAPSPRWPSSCRAGA